MKKTNDTLILKGNLESAKYKEQAIKEYKNNPFIEALPHIFSDEDVIDRFDNVPIFETDYKYKDKKYRYHLLKNIKSYTQILPIHLSIEVKLSTMIRRGYLARNPNDANYLKRLEILNELKDNKKVSYQDIDFKMRYMSSTAESLTILGISGMGKTTAIERLLLMYPQVIKHNNYKNKHFTRTQIVWLKIDCPYDGSLATLCKSFFKAIDDILNTNYLEKYGYSNRVTSTMMIYMTHLASLYGIGILVIDEIQQLINAKNSMDEMLNFFVTLSNTVGIPTVLIGTPKAQELFNGNFRQARRASSNGCIMWDRMDKESSEWKIFINSLWDMQCLKEYAELSDEINDAFYESTQGITSLAINLFILVQERALTEETEKITIKLINDTLKNDLKLLQPMLKAIKSNNLKEIAKYDDITIDFEAISNSNFRELELSGKLEKIYKERIENLEIKKNRRVENLSIELRALNICKFLSDKDLISIIKKEVDTNPIDIEYDELKGICIRKAINKNDQLQSKENSVKVVNILNRDSLLELYNKAANNKKHPYELLKKHGYIKNPMDELIC